MLLDKEQIEYSAAFAIARPPPSRDDKTLVEELLLARDCGHKKSAKQVNDGNVEQRHKKARDCKSPITRGRGGRGWEITHRHWTNGLSFA